MATPRKSKAQLMLERRLVMRQTLWPEVTDDDLWTRQGHDGFTTIPRTMSMMIGIMDDLSKGQPLGATYLALWCYVWDDCYVTIKDPKGMAYEIGFSGQRSEATWEKRISLLEEFGFIKTRPTPSGKYGQVLILNPYKTIYRLNKEGKVQQTKYEALFARALEVQATDLVDEAQADKKVSEAAK